MAPARVVAPPVLQREGAVQQRSFETRDLKVDLCVCGGGLAGAITAIAAARNGVSVVLLQDRPVLGGNASSEVRLWILGATSHMFNNNRYAREGGLVEEILVENLHRNPEGNPLILDTILLEKVREEPNIQLFLNTALIGCDKDGDRISRVQGFSSQCSLTFFVYAQQYADCTGDGALSFLAGAPFRIGAEQKDEFGEDFAPSSEYGHLLGHSIYFYSKDAGRPVKFHPPSYALKDVESEIPRFRSFSTKEMGCSLWWIEYGGRLDTVHDTEDIKWELWRVVYGVWDYFKNSGRFREAENLTLEWVGTIPGKRESRRFIGPTVMKQQDIIEQRFHTDAVSHGGWSLDLHPADGVFSEVDGCTQWHAKGVYQIPFSSMLCSEIPNLMYGGRIISATHVAFASTRVMATCGANANALGVAAAMCKRLSVDPVQLLAKDNMKSFQTELMRFGQFIPGYKLQDPQDLVRVAKSITASSSFELADLPANGPPKALVRSLAQMMPLEAGQVPTFYVTAQAVEETTLTVQLRGSKKAYNYTPEVILEEKNFSLQPGSNELEITFTVENPQTQYVFLSFLQNEAVAMNTSLTRVSGLMTVEHECTQEPPSDVGVETFERWTPVRRPQGHNLALRVSEPIKAWNITNIQNGVPRPTKRANCWVPQGSGERQMLEISWDAPISLKELVVLFDTDYDHALESVLRGHPERNIPFCVSSWRVLDLSGGEEKELFREDGNYHSRRSAVMDPAVSVTKIGVEILGLNGDENVRGGIFEVRAYE
ncbi:FAD dependent oxidoreductase domain-containing protein [Sarocladium implicatum]|nr:FAD dependent oxidoreductase domain-containing protein [Sarocladium implicatum]